MLAAYAALLSEKYASCAVIRLRRSAFIEAMYAFSLVFANFGMAIAARMPMMTTTIKSSIRVKPLVLRRIEHSRPLEKRCLLNPAGGRKAMAWGCRFGA